METTKDLISSIKIEVKEWKNSAIDQNVIFFIIEITKRDQEKWIIEKRYSEFDELNKNLKKLISDLPNLPGKSFFKLSEKAQLDERRAGLDNYLKHLVVRPDVFNSEPLKQFLQLDRHASETIANPPKLEAEISGFVHGVRDFFYVQNKGVLFVLSGDMNVVSRVDAYLTNMKMPWEKDAPPTLLSVGAIECWIQQSDTEYKLDRIWNKTYPSQAICLFWEPITSTLIVGLDEGKINVLKVPSEVGFVRYEEIIEAKVHEERVMGIYYDNISGIIYTISEDKTFKTIEKGEVTNVIRNSNTGLTSLVGDKEYKRCFITNRSGNLFIYDISSPNPNLIFTLQTQMKGAIRGLTVDTFKNYVFTGAFDDGEIGVFDIEKPGREKFAKQSASLRGKTNIRYIEWSSSRSEIFVGHKDGTIAFWNAKKAQPVYVLKAHQNDITKLQWFEDRKLLLTSSKEKVIKIWSLPKLWRDKNIEQAEERDYEIQKKTETLLKSQQIYKKHLEDSDEDDLAGWHKY